MNASAIKDMFLDIIGGTSLDDDAIDKLYDNALKLLNQLTANIGADFVNDHTIPLLLALQFQYDLIQRNYDDADKGFKSLTRFAKEIVDDWTQDEQIEQINYMGDRG